MQTTSVHGDPRFSNAPADHGCRQKTAYADNCSERSRRHSRPQANTMRRQCPRPWPPTHHQQLIDRVEDLAVYIRSAPSSAQLDPLRMGAFDGSTRRSHRSIIAGRNAQPAWHWRRIRASPVGIISCHEWAEVSHHRRPRHSDYAFRYRAVCGPTWTLA